MAKFKVGDKVVVVDRPDENDRYCGIANDNQDKFKEFVGKTSTIRASLRDGEHNIYLLEDIAFFWPEYLLEKAEGADAI